MIASALPFAAADPVSHVLAHPLHQNPLFTLQVAEPGTDIPTLGIVDGRYSFFITNHMLMTLVVAVLVGLAFWWASKRIQAAGEGHDRYRTKGTFAQLLETMCVFIREQVARPNLGHLTDRYIGYLWTIFFFILFANLLGLVPFGYVLQLLTGNLDFQHWGGTATSNLALNGVLAVFSFLAVIVIGIREAGVKHFLGHFNPVGWNASMLPIGLMMFVLEWMGLIIKCTVLAMRLFGTMMAGHLVIAAFVLLIFSAANYSSALGYGVGVAVLIGGVVLTLLEVFIACLQAFIFTFLTVLFISSGAVHDEEHGAHDEAELDPGTHAVPVPG